MDLDTLIADNYNFFKKEIEPFYFVFTKYDGRSVVTKADDINAPHLFGGNKSFLPAYKNAPAKKILNDLKNGKLKSIFSLISKERYNSNTLTIEEKFILKKNLRFIEIFNFLISEIDNLRLYRKEPGDDFDTDYLYLSDFNDGAKGYIGIIGDDDTDYHIFNSIIYEEFEKTRGIAQPLKSIKRIPKDAFIESEFAFSASRRNVKHQHKNRSKNIKFDFKKEKNKINKLLPDNLRIDFGRFGGSKSIQLYREDELLCKNLLDDNTVTDIETLISKAKEYTK